MKAVTQFRSRAVALVAENIDTDQVIPARFLQVTDKAGLGAGLFADWRYRASGEPDPDFPLNHPAARGAQILVTGTNFGCGSSREHAAWALCSYGFRAIISPSFADIFRNNALKNGLLPIAVETDVHSHILGLLAESPSAPFHVDLGERRLTLPDGSRMRFPIDAFARHCLLNGQDELRFLLDQEVSIARFEKDHPSGFSTLTSSDAPPADEVR